jgi:anti-sigma regulatory factor (Ser/Thr protein kinase)
VAASEAGLSKAEGTMDNGIPWGHESALPAETISVAAARNFVRLHLLEHDLRSLVDDARLVVSEFATNAVMNARTPFVVTLCRLNGYVTLTVSDRSPEEPTPTTQSVLDEGGAGSGS